jgi:MFS family permease
MEKTKQCAVNNIHSNDATSPETTSLKSVSSDTASAATSSTGYWPLLKNLSFTAYLSNQVLINLGDGIFGLLVTFSALQLEATATELGMIVSCIALPRGLMGLYGGVVADQNDRRLIMLLSDLARTTGIALIGILCWFDWLNLINLTALASLVTMTSAFSKPAGKAIMPEFLKSSDLYLANGMTQSVLWPSFFVGAFLAGVLDGIELFPAYSYLICAAVFAVAGLVLLLIRCTTEKKPKDSVCGPILADILSGFSELAKQRPLLIRVMCFMAYSLVWRGMTQVGLPLYTVEALNLPANVYSTMIIATGLGEFISSLIIAKLSISRSLRLSFIGDGLLAIVVLGLCFNVAEGDMAMYFSIGAAALIGVSASIVHIPLTAAIQTDISSMNSGKVFSIWNTLGTLGGSIGAIIISTLVAWMGIKVALMILSLMTVLSVLVSYGLAYPSAKQAKPVMVPSVSMS